MSGARSTKGGLFFIWVLQLTALFHKAIWLWVYKKVRVGQEVRGIKQTGDTVQSDCVYVCVYKTVLPGVKQENNAVWDPHPSRGKGLKRSAVVGN